MRFACALAVVVSTLTLACGDDSMQATAGTQGGGGTGQGPTGPSGSGAQGGSGGNAQGGSGGAGGSSSSSLCSKRFGDTDSEHSHAVATDSSGNVVITGDFGGSVDFGGGPLTSASTLQDIFVAKYDGNCNHLWSRGFGDSADEIGFGVASDAAGNTVITGYFRDTVDFGGGQLTSAGSWDIFVAKFDDAGNHVWSKRFGGSSFIYDAGWGVATDSAGNVVITGHFGESVDFGGGPLTSANNFATDIFVAKFDGGGNHLWSRAFGGPNDDEGRSVATDASGNVVVTGFFSDTVDFGGGPLTSATFQSDIFVAKFDEDGNHQWSKSFGDVDFDEGFGVATDAMGNVVITGDFDGTVDFGGGLLFGAGSEDIFVAKYDADGNHLWSQGFGDIGQEVGRGVATDSAGNVIITGEFSGFVSFGAGPVSWEGGDDVFVAKFDSSGNHVWSESYGSANVERSRGIATDGSDNVFLTGDFSASIDFGGGVLTTAGLGDIFLAKRAP